jgi:isoleucyl-tRNA synthetase
MEAYQTLYRCLEVVAQLSSPIAPFFSDQLFRDLNSVSKRTKAISVHLTDFPKADESLINKDLEERMEYAQKISSMVLSLRKKSNMRVRQPLQRVMIPVLDQHFREVIAAVEDLILSEVNVKKLEYITDESGILVKKIKPNFKSLGPKYGKLMKQIAGTVNQFNQDDIRKFETEKQFVINIAEEEIVLSLDDVEISTDDIPGWSVATQDYLTVALDLSLTPELKAEGMARELVNRIQNLRKDIGLEVTDRIKLRIEKNKLTDEAFHNFTDYICSETLAVIEFVEKIDETGKVEVELLEDIIARLYIEKR